MKTIILFLSLTIAACAQASNFGNTVTGPNPNSLVAAATLSTLRAEKVIDEANAAPTRTWMRQLARQQLGENKVTTLYLVEYSLSHGGRVIAIAEDRKSPVPEESGLMVYVISKILRPDGKAVPPHE